MLKDLEKSGFTAQDAKRLGCVPFSAEDIFKRTNKHLGAAYEIPYYGFNGVKTNFSRFKLTDPPSPFTPKIRYWQAPNSPPKLYIPPLIKWQSVLKDTSKEVWLTEGEKKAAALAKQGVPCLAVAGVWNWTSKKHAVAMVPELIELGLSNRPFVLCFDSDASDNVLVKGALATLALELERRGAQVRLCQLPTLPGHEKTGLDDFLVHHKKKGLTELAQLDKEALGLSAELHALNTEICYVEEQLQVFQFKTLKFLPQQAMTSVVYGDRVVSVPGRDGNMRDVNVAAEWLKWPQRRVVSRLTYAPGEPQDLPDGAYNLWKGWGCQSKQGPVKPFLELVDYLTAGLTAQEKKWFWQWMAYPLQHPGAKMASAVLVYSQHQGTGKTVLGYTLREIYGDNAIEVSQEQLHSGFNEWARCRQFVIGDEITGSDRRQDADRLKHMVTRERLIINQKYQPTYELPDCVNYYLTTNQPDAVHVEAHDRRYLVIEVRGTPLPLDFYRGYDKWFRSPQGRAAAFHHLLNIDLAGFSPTHPAPETDAKRAMHRVSGTEADGIVRELLRDPTMLQLAGQPVQRDLFTLSELVLLLDPSGRLGRMQLARALRRHGAPAPFIITVGGATKAVYAVANFEKWRNADHATRAAHYEQREISRQRRSKKLKGETVDPKA